MISAAAEYLDVIRNQHCILKFRGNIFFSFLFLSALLVPVGFSPAVSFLLLLHLFVRNKSIVNRQAFLALPFFLFVFVSTIHVIVAAGEIGKIFVDIYRWANIAVIILLVRHADRKPLLVSFYVFFILTFMFSTLQQLMPQNYCISHITSIYVSEALMEELFVPGFVRSTGFNEGPGHVGLVALVACIIAPFVFSSSSQHRWLSITITHFIAILIILFAAAKGALIAYLVYLLSLLRFQYFITISLISVIPSWAIWSLLNDDIYYIFRLANISSASERFNIWKSLTNFSEINPLGIIIGFGRVDHFSDVSIFDSDWVFIFISQGILGLILVLCLIFYIVIRAYKGIRSSSLIVFFAIVVAGGTNPFLTDIKFGPLYWAVLLSLLLWRKNEDIHRGD